MAFVQTNGKNFTLNGQIFIPFGGSIYNINGQPAQVTIKIPDAVNMSHNMIRIVNYLAGDPSPGYEYDSFGWSVVDYAISLASDNGLKVLLDLSDIQGVSDARGYVFGDTNNLTMWSNFVTWLSTRVNTVSGKVYKNDDTIAIISIVGEAGGLSQTSAYTNYNTIGGYLKNAGFQQVIHSGGAVYSIFDSCIKAPNIDCCSVHTYDPVSSDESNFPICKASSDAWNKPWFIEEYGASQNVGDAVRANYMRRKIITGFKYGCAGFLFWNNDRGVGGSGISSQVTPRTASVIKAYSKVTSYSPRTTVLAAQFGGI